MTELQARIHDVLANRHHGFGGYCLINGKAEDTEEVLVSIIKELQDRLEMGFAYNAKGEQIECKDIPDGITCRDITIRELEAQLSAKDIIIAEKDAWIRELLAQIT